MSTVKNFIDYCDPLVVPVYVDSDKLLDNDESLAPLTESNHVKNNNILDPITTESNVESIMNMDYLGESINGFYNKLFKKENVSKSNSIVIDQLSAQLENTNSTSRTWFPEFLQDNCYSTENILVIDAGGDKVKIKILINSNDDKIKKGFQFNRITLFYRGYAIYRSDFDMAYVDSNVDSILFMIDKKIFEECLNNN